MKFTLVINGAPWSSQSALSALHFATAAIDSGHEIYRLFFYQDGASNASLFCVPPQDETDIPAGWEALIAEHSIDAVVCAASALKRGILDAAEADRYDKPGSNLRPGFTVSGLGQLIDAAQNSDRVVSFVV
ncbi:MAG: sulfurtransferase complex subunit TusD [Gammaproteobacteria bacterium]|nr:sulfurtransferase complex subunit TusD [Gammaproteobacteria bacterium]